MLLTMEEHKGEEEYFSLFTVMIRKLLRSLINYTVFLVKKISCFLTIHMMNIYFIRDCSLANFRLSLLLIKIDITLKYYLYTIVKMSTNIFRISQIPPHVTSATHPLHPLPHPPHPT